MKTTTSIEELENRIKLLEPWRYNHSYGEILIKSDTFAAQLHDRFGKGLMRGILTNLIADKDPKELRALDLGCLEGHYTDILCSLGLKEVVAVDVSEGHIERAEFLLKELKGYENVTIVQGSVGDENFMKSLGRFHIILFHGLLYHLKDPLKIFDILEGLIPDDGVFYLLLSTQYKMPYNLVVSPMPLADLQIKPLEEVDGDHSSGLLYSPADGSVFERCSFRLNPSAVYRVLKLYGYQGLIAYDSPIGYDYSFHSNLVLTKRPQPSLLVNLNNHLKIPGVKFYEWDGASVDSYRFNKKWISKLLRFAIRLQFRIFKTLKLGRKNFR